METNATAVPVHESHSVSALTVLTIVGAAVLSGVGLFGVMYWLLTLNWLYFLSLAPLTVGAYLLFTRATGSDRA
jgi:hypothetical protein